MKIAILFSGRLNNNIEQYNNCMEFLIQSNQVDFFISHSKTPNKQLIQDFVKLYKPKKIMENDETYFNVEKYPKHESSNRHNVMCMFKNRIKVYHLFQQYIKETNVKYDIVISSRCDLWFQQKFNLQSLLENVKHNQLCIPIEHDFGINDQFAVGNVMTISTYLQTYNSLFEFLESGILFHPETLLRDFLQSKKVNIHRFSIKYFIQR